MDHFVVYALVYLALPVVTLGILAVMTLFQKWRQTINKAVGDSFLAHYFF